jgi:uncharacterized protein YndB with AHSA1/START domain
MTTQGVTDAVVVEIDIDATPDEVFAALIEPDSVVGWWGEDGDGYRCTAFRSAARKGGRWWSEHKGKATDPVCILAGEYIEFEPPRRLAFTWDFESYTPETEALPVTTVAIELEARDGVTHVRLTHSGFLAGSKHAEDHRGGWRSALAGLSRFVGARAA